MNKKIKKTFHIITIGCQMNKADSERIYGYLENHGYRHSNDTTKSDYVILTTCGIRQTAEDRIYGLIPRIKKINPKTKIILTGCLSEREDVRKRLATYVDIWLPIVQLPELSEFIDSESNLIGKFKKISLAKKDYLAIAPKHSSLFTAYVPIGNGCNNFCTYCVVPYARGRETYRKAAEIIKEIKGLVDKKYKEIILIAQNVNSYRSPSDTGAKNEAIDFAELLRMADKISGDFWISFITSHPKDLSAELIEVVKQGEKICEYLHLPVQSGDNEILKKMNRRYTNSDYKKLTAKIRKKIPDISLSTDIIVGFPGETRKQFLNTARLCKDVKFDMAYISQYSSRPNTKAASLKDNVLKIEKRKRENELMEILKKTSLEYNEKIVGKVVPVLIYGKNKKGKYYGKTRNQKIVIIETDSLEKNIIGSFQKVEIRKAKEFGLEGKI